MNELQPVALGSAPADVVVRDGRVYAGGSFHDRDVAIRGDRIAALLDDSIPVTGPETTVIDASNHLVLPGLIDAHEHADVHLSIERKATALLETGTTSVVSESSGLGTAFGVRGVETLLDVTADLPLSVFLSVPPQLLYDTFEPTRADEAEATALEELFTHERIVAVGEVDWIHVVGRDSPAERLFDQAERENARVVGHGAGCSGDRLRAYATVVGNDHEAITTDGVLERAANGIHVVGRYGSIRDDLDALTTALIDPDSPLDPTNVSLSTDGVWPEDLRDGFGMAEVVRKTVEEGVEPGVAIDAASKNPARHFGLPGRGAIEPGAYADLLVVPDLETMEVQCVVADGDVVVADGESRVSVPDVTYPEFVSEPIDLDVRPDHFVVSEADAPDGPVRAMAVGEGLLTTETRVEPDREAGHLGPAPERDVLTVTIFDRTGALDEQRERVDGQRERFDDQRDRVGDQREHVESDPFTGFLTGFGLEAGAVSTTVAWEVPAVVTVAADTSDAVVATERIATMGGGFAVAEAGEIVVDLPYAIGGAAADLPVETVADGFDSLREMLHSAGVTDERPLLTLQTLTFPGVPALKLSPSGYADLSTRSVVGLDSSAP